jgi:phthalate 3,4-dioxygenase alpha subunit
MWADHLEMPPVTTTRAAMDTRPNGIAPLVQTNGTSACEAAYQQAQA